MNTTRYSIELGDARLPVIIRRHPSSRRIVVRYQPLQTCVSVTLPRYVTIKQGLDFVQSKRGWIEGQVNNHPVRVPFADGQIIPVLGQEYTIRHRGGRGVVQLADSEMLVHGGAEFTDRRVRQWLIDRAREEITPLARQKAEILKVQISKISLRDNSSCWGSCTHAGDLSFSWRLVLATPEILDYVVCHEVAHLREMNHSDKFWQLVDDICPSWQASRHWLKSKGKQLYAYG